MPTLLPGIHRGPRDEEANAASSSSSNRRLWSNPFGIGDSRVANRQQNDMHMSTQPAPSTAAHPDVDLEQGRVQHERGTSGRSILSAVSLPSLSILRQRDRDQERQRQAERAQTEGSAGGGNAATTAITLPIFTSESRSAARKSRSSRREREEAATLFGPNLANYFGSGISSSGAVSISSHGAGVPQPPVLARTLTPLAPDSNNPLIASPIADSPAGMDSAYSPATNSARRARLGSRGRARGASLSGLSMMSLGAESVTSLGGINTERTMDTLQPTGMMQGSTADLIDQLTQNGPSADGHIAMSEGVDIATLQRWIQRSTGVVENASAGAAAPFSYGPPVCTTLQSFVNLKRNTLKLTPKLQSGSPSAKASDADVNLLRNKPSLTLLPTLSYGAGSAAATSTHLPEPTHALYFEYDCAAPYASVQIFVRASRKHGSWQNYQPPANASDPLSGHTNPDGSPAWLAQAGPPLHVLGWPVHVAKLTKGFGSGHTANIPLNLQYYAPPKPSKAGPKPTVEATTPAAIPETPGFEFQRQLALDADDADEETAANTRANLGGPTSAVSPPATVPENGPLALAAQGVIAQPLIEEETKEQRLAREKAERETLKVAIVVEALDEHARPLREPNLQTSYLRLTSLPVKKSVAERLADLTTDADAAPAEPRTWSSQVEGQEAEIGPHRFQLQELYGLSSKPPAVAPVPAEGDGEEDAPGGTNATFAAMDMDASNGSECLICLSSPPTTLLLPCTHGLCLECAVQLRDSVVGIRQSERRRGRTPRRKFACPVCRRAYTSMLHLSKADEKSQAQQKSAAAAASAAA